MSVKIIFMPLNTFTNANAVFRGKIKYVISRIFIIIFQKMRNEGNGNYERAVTRRLMICTIY